MGGISTNTISRIIIICIYRYIIYNNIIYIMLAYDTKLRVHTWPSCRAHCRDQTTLYGGGGGSTSEPDKRRLVNQRARRPGPDRARTGPHASRAYNTTSRSSYLVRHRCRHECERYYIIIIIYCYPNRTWPPLLIRSDGIVILLYCALTPVLSRCRRWPTRR